MRPPINDQDIDSAIRYLGIHDPENSSYDDALEFLARLQDLAKDMVNKDIKRADLFKRALDAKIGENTKKVEPGTNSPPEHQESS